MRSDNDVYLLKIRTKNTAIELLVTLSFVAIGAMMIPSQKWAGAAISIFFGILSLVNLVRLFPNSSYLKLDEVGFTICSLFRAHSYRWSDVSGFTIGWIARKKMVMFDFSDDYKASSRLRKFNLLVSEHEGALPDTYGKSHEELVDLLNNFWSSRVSIKQQ
jgi:hypothetical protein